MDYRKRNYYLVHIDWRVEEMRMEYFHNASATLKIHEVSNKIYNEISRTCNFHGTKILSCLKEEAQNLEFELIRAVHRDKETAYIQLTKEILKQ